MKKLGKGRLLISVDPGYDGTKVTVNGERFDIPKETIKKIGYEYESVDNLDGIYEIKTDEGTYLCGPNIQILVSDNKDFHERFDKGAEQSNNYSYFATNEFVANTLAAIALALFRAESQGIAKIDELDKTDLYLVVTLPHEALESMTSTVANALIGTKAFTFKGIVDGVAVEKDIKVNIKKGDGHFLVVSQVIALLLGYMTDEEGNEIDSLQDLYPTLAVDAGYYTVGSFSISKTKTISGAESETHYGMKVIHENVAAAINKKYGLNLKSYDMDNLFGEDDGYIVIPMNISASGVNERVDCNEILKEETEKVFVEYHEYLKEKYNCFVKHKQILFGGGTGEIFYNLFVELFAAYYPNLKLTLVKYELDGSEVSPREAISAGAYKILLNRLED